jgi:ubiquinone/menaquinone biosynthesis C-methylase UbiE
MPSTQENLSFWNNNYDWSTHGDEWSVAWGGADTQWHGTLFPRIMRHLPVHTILEIAPGFGRWTQFLAGLCKRLIVVDLSSKCIDACRQRFRDTTHIEYHVNDGRTLPMVADGSVDFVFSFDSLVHVDAEAIESYLSELGRVLKPGGTGFIHHSNVAERAGRPSIDRFLASPHRLHALFRRPLPVRQTHGRALDVSASVFRAGAAKAGVSCISQEKVNWGGDDLIDCLSTIRKSTGSSPQATATLTNPHFMREASYLAGIAQLYGGAGTDVS